jgi:putative transposase
MARTARIQAPGSVHHIISNFINDEWRIRDDRYRREYLVRLGRAAARVDWQLLAYTIMSSHTHTVALQQSDSLRRLFGPLHTGFADWLRRVDERRGPAFAGRPFEKLIDPALTLRVIAYVHNNPVRAQVVRDPADSDWTSHRAFLGLAPAPAWLDVERALTLCGFSATPSGRVSFHEYVVACSQDPRNSELSREGLDAVRNSARHATASPVELASPTVSATDGTHYPLVALPRTPLKRVWTGDLHRVLALVAAETGVPVSELTSRSRRREVVRARRLFILVATRYLHRGMTEAGAMVGISCTAASRMLWRIPAQVEELIARAERIARLLEEELTAPARQEDRGV